jgi:hypothetical protein
MVEFWYNTNYHKSLQTIPFEVLYRYNPHSLISYILDLIKKNQAIKEHLEDRSNIIKTNLNKA